jgi:hypothetical protein
MADRHLLARELPFPWLDTPIRKEASMTVRKEMMPEYPEYYEPDYSGRPLEFVKDKKGNGWLCDKGIDKNGDLKSQGCWRCDEVTFPCGGH